MSLLVKPAVALDEHKLRVFASGAMAGSLRSNDLRPSVPPVGLACQPKLVRAKAGGANESRTRDLLHAMQARYQLRYSPPTKNASRKNYCEIFLKTRIKQI